MVLISQLRAMKPELVTETAYQLANVKESFKAQLDTMKYNVQTATADWKGEAAAAASVKTLAEHLAGTHIVDAIGSQEQAIKDGVNALSSARSSALGVADDAIGTGCTVSDEGHVKAPDLKYVVTDPTAYLLLQNQANEKAKAFEARLIPALHLFDELDTAAEAAINGEIAEMESLIRDPDSTPASTLADDILNGKAKPPEDPKAFKDWWNSLSEGEKNEMYLHDQYIGNNDNMPTGDKDHHGRDYFNRLKLDDELGRATTAAAQVDQLKAQHPDWLAGKNIPDTMVGGITKDRMDYDTWQRQLDDATKRAKYLPDLQATDKSVRDNPDRKLMVLDTQTGRQAHTAVAIGDPDTADHISVTTPGINTTVGESIGNMTNEAAKLRQEALTQLSHVPGHKDDTVATIAWIGYDPPQINDKQGVGDNLTGVSDVVHDDQAKDGARSLARFYDGLQVTHQGGPADVTAIGHSYGSLTTGLALQEPGNHGITNAIFYGSPGIEAETPQQLGVQPGHVFTMETPDDPIQWVYDGPDIARHTPLLPAILWGHDVMGLGDFGPNPATNPNFTHLETGTVTTPDGRSLEAAHKHSDYGRTASNGQLYTPGYNIAAVVAGLADQNAIHQR
ncbi:alpha/beta hydrolase [Mycobacteroides stephanolepidis]|uniref:Alpha/beta hydrolase n=1 Tax=[Mycobacterium] stephanolepidis TaxID=1520670 RepID=A0A1Z4EWJ7_9MYCO|nr:alpha/beta hydrolase [[Mycobacterium] stephanolepidis]BAX97332.1 alpha/beta hydrolase [[Mycobacterium] stephanolepidis]